MGSMSKSKLTRRTVLQTAGAGAAALGGAALGPARRPARAAQSSPMKLSLAVFGTGPVDDDNLFKQTLEERFDVELDLMVFDRQNMKEQINPRIASGEIPDVIMMSDFGMRYTDYVEQGVLREVPLDAFKQYMPKYVEATKAFNSLVWFAVQSEEKYWGVPYLQPSQLSPFTDGWRTDWLDAVGITEMPRTIEQFEEAYTKFVQDDPDGNGESNTYALTSRGKDAAHWTFASYFGAFGAVPHMWMQQADGTLKWGGTGEGARQALTLLNDWYNKGLIDPEFVTTDHAQNVQLWANGRIGYVTPSNWYRLIPGGEHYDSVMAVNPEAKVEMAWAPQGPEGKYGYFNWGPLTGGEYFFGNELGDDRLAQTLEMFEAMLTDPELATLLRYGVEGEHWERDSESNAIRAIPPYDTPDQRGSLGANIQFVPVPAIQDDWAGNKVEEYTAKAKEGNLSFVPYAGLLVPSEVSEAAANLNPMQGQWYLDFVAGSRSLDDWDDFVSEWNGEGGEELIAATNESVQQIEAAHADIDAALAE
ncbi:MAG: hypothetical protein ACRDJH_02190 [Thermomicrobiales bacterium]